MNDAGSRSKCVVAAEAHSPVVEDTLNVAVDGGDNGDTVATAGAGTAIIVFPRSCVRSGTGEE